MLKIVKIFYDERISSGSLKKKKKCKKLSNNKDVKSQAQIKDVNEQGRHATEMRSVVVVVVVVGRGNEQHFSLLNIIRKGVHLNSH